MNCKIPFTKDIDFEHKLYEITSISLEHEIKIENNTLKGNFIVSGDYKSHEVSVNKEPFSYILPFEIDLREDIDEKTLEFMIEDFTYEVIENNILRVNIDFNVIASPKEKKETEDRLFKSASDLFSNEEVPILEELKEEPTQELKEEKQEEIVESVQQKVQEEKLEQEKVSEEEKLKTEETIISNIKTEDNAYTTYHIHMVSDGETVETICSMYNSNTNTLSEYNDLQDLTSGDKLIIPENNE